MRDRFVTASRLWATTAILSLCFAGNCIKAQGTSQKILWREDIYNNELSDTMSTIVLDSSYFNTVTDAEKAAIAYVATFVGNECWWDGEYRSDRSNLKCRILTALGLRYQCSETHLGFLRQWFRDDSTAFAKLENCPTVPFTSPIQETFDSISISAAGNFITVTSAITGVNIRDDKEWHRVEKVIFRITGNKLIIENSEP
jgi:hypothetical protein